MRWFAYTVLILAAVACSSSDPGVKNAPVAGAVPPTPTPTAIPSPTPTPDYTVQGRFNGKPAVSESNGKLVFYGDFIDLQVTPPLEGGVSALTLTAPVIFDPTTGAVNQTPYFFIVSPSESSCYPSGQQWGTDFGNRTRVIWSFQTGDACQKQLSAMQESGFELRYLNVPVKDHPTARWVKYVIRP